MRAWYDIRAVRIDHSEDEVGVRGSEIEIRALIESQTEGGLASGDIVLAGFSQGGAMALHTGLRYPGTLAGVLALSSYLPLAGTLDVERERSNDQTPLFLGHGTEDPVVPLALGNAAYRQLSALDYRVLWHDYRMGHEVNLDEIRDIGRWLIGLLS